MSCQHISDDAAPASGIHPGANRDIALGKHDKTDAPGEGAQRSPSPEKHPEPDYSLSCATSGESAPNDPLLQVTRESIQQAGYQVLGNDLKWSGLSEAGQIAFAIGSRCSPRFPFTLGERRTRRNDLWYRFLSLAAGGQTMPDDEFVEMVLYTTGRIKDCKTLAKKLLDRFQSLAGVFNAELYQLADLGPIDQDIFNAFRAVRGVQAIWHAKRSGKSR